MSQIDDMNIVVIDDNRDHLSLMKHCIEKAFASDPFRVAFQGFENPADALAEITDKTDQVILIDYCLNGSTGIDWISDFDKANVGPVILVTSSGDEHIATDAFRAGASDYIIKSGAFNSPMILHRAIMESLRKYRLEITNSELTKKLKSANIDLNAKNRKLTELTDTAHRFVEDVAHEFRTPLTVIKEFSSILADGLGGDVTEKQTKYLNYIIASTGDLAGLIDDFLNSSRLRSNSICVNRQLETVQSVTDSVAPMLQSRASSKSMNLDFDIDSDLPPIYVDSDKMQRSIINLVVNAIKFSEAGGTVRISATNHDEHSILFGVHDQGPGLPEDAVKELFNRFNQGTADQHQLANGFGLGLNIVKELVAINLGEVLISSKLGQGSSFSFTVPHCKDQSIVRGLLNQATKRIPNPRIVALQAHRTNHDQPTNEFAEELRSIIYPTDIVLNPADSDKLMVIGMSDDDKAFCDRVLRVEQENQSKKNSNWSPMVIKKIGSWSTQCAEHHVNELLKTHPEKEFISA